ncbi:RluA family pseudouridine synthase [uncultured Tyzzerella sp.]|uniref:RluA family pseudouridine synthase n=1 Tax=uncultured Tyzzerella sp. TaxID=2321398 RepID=UPI0029429F06|nr:RluA family pseudouridine synthase [uncultured Tyzzerella sp.]
MVEIKINKLNENQRLDKYLLKYLNKAPKSFIYKMLRKKNIKLNGKKAEGNEIIISGDIINIYLSDDTINSFKEDKQINKTNQDFKIIFEDKNIILCYKPINLVSQPDISNKNNSLNDQLIFYMHNKGEYILSSDFTPSICNRLDRNTSGIITFGKNLKALQSLNKAFKNNLIDKYYLTAVYGNVTQSGTIELYHKKDGNKVVLSKKYIPNSKKIITEYQPIANKDNKTLLNIKLITGKTHQIRASLEHIGYPIIGDKKYNNNNFNHFNLKYQFLHCYKIHFKHQDEFLNYLSDKTFICKNMDNSFKNLLDFFNYNI